MASILKVDALQGVTAAGSILVTGEGNSTTTNLQSGLMKAWVRYDHTVPSVTDSFNESSVTDINTGVWSLQFTNNMSNGNYGWNNGLQDGRVDGVNTGTVPASGTIRYYQRVASSGAVNDGHFTLASIHGDLA